MTHDLNTGRGRLARLADALENDLPKRFEAEGRTFDMRAWRTDLDPECGTAACAAGFACMLPEFNQRGLVLEWSDNLNVAEAYPIFKQEDGVLNEWEGLAAFFGVGLEVVDWIFDANCYKAKALKITPKMVAARIRKYLKGTEAQP